MSEVLAAASLAGAGTAAAKPRETVVNPGNAQVSHRWVLTVEATATTIRFINHGEDEPPLVLTPTVVGHDYVIDARARTVTDNAAAAPDLVAPGSAWPALLPGGNNIQVTGGTGVLTWYPLYV